MVEDCGDISILLLALSVVAVIVIVVHMPIFALATLDFISHFGGGSGIAFIAILHSPTAPEALYTSALIS